MTDKHIIDGCEFQSYCIEYKDISYLKIMPICAIHELSIACHDKENKCKYYKLYKQLKRKEQECELLKKDEKSLLNVIDDLQKEKNIWEEKYNDLGQDFDQLKQTLKEIKDMCSEIDCESLMENSWCGNTDFKMGCCEKFFKRQILQKISEVENES